MIWISMHWDMLAMMYCFVVLFLLPISSERFRLVDCFMVLGAGFLLVSGFLGLIR